MKGKENNLHESKQVIKFSFIKLLLQKNTQKHRISESELSKHLIIIKIDNK